MKILQLGKFYPIRGGVEKVMYDLTIGLSERGIDCDMLCAMSEGKSHILPLTPHGRLIGQHTWIKAYATTIAPSMITQLRRTAKAYDIIHVHHPDPMAALSLFLSRYKGKVVLHWHSDIEKQKWLLKLYRPLQQWLVRRADAIIGTTPVYTAESPYLAQVQQKIHCLPIGIEPVHPTPEAVEKIRSRYPGKKIIFSLGRLVAYKGFRYLVEAGRYLNDEYVILIGGSGALKEELTSLIAQRGLQEKVHLLGRISDEDLPGYFGACHLFCMSSVQKTEAFGIVQLEAMSCSKPVVATTIPHSGVSWVNAHEISGLNVPPCDAKALAKAFTTILGDKKLYAKLSEGAFNRYKTLFTKDKNMKSLLDIYQKL